MPRLFSALVILLGLLATPGCIFGSSCDEEDGTLDCYCEENPENCRDTPEEARADDASALVLPDEG